MRRPVRSLLLALVAGLGILTAAPSEALQTPAFTFVVDCRDPDGVGTNDFGLDMPNGWYAVTAVGACAPGNSPTSFNVGTPCSLPVVGSIPCVSPGVTVSNVPGAACWVTVNGVSVQPCPGGNGATLLGCDLVIVVDNQCLIAGTAGTIYHNPGPMRARYADCCHGDNVGFYVVTAVWTPL